MRRLVVIIGVLAVCAGLTAKEVVRGTAGEVEREQRFTYFFYAAEESLRSKDYARAFLLLEMCEDICPTDGKTHDLLGVLYDALGDHDTARAHFRAAYKSEPLDLWDRYTEVLMRSGDKRQQREAIAIVEHVVRCRPAESDSWEDLRDMYAVTGDFKRAIKAQDRLDKLRGYDAYSALFRYRAYVMWNKPQRAIDAVERYLEEDPTNMQFVLFRIELYERTHVRWAVLEQAYIDALELQPQNALVLNNYAYGLCLNGGDLKRAERMSETAIRMEPSNATYLDTYAWVLHLQGQDVLASFYIRKALDLAREEDRAVIRRHYESICK